VDIRFVAATHRHLDAAVAAGTFRQDLFFRLNAVSLVVPPLRERRKEILLLAQKFVADACARMNVPARVLSPAARRALEDHSWPGNVRELKNVLERAVLFAPDHTIEAQHLGLAAPVPSASVAPPSAPTTRLKAEIEEVERKRILEMLEACGGNQTHAAKALGISRRMLVKRLDEYAVRRPRKRT
jgi:DNA-binding NtrC family response regulator